MTEVADDDNPACLSVEQRAERLQLIADEAARSLAYLAAKEAAAIRTGNPVFHWNALSEAQTHSLPIPPASAEYLKRVIDAIARVGREIALEPNTKLTRKQMDAAILKAMEFSGGGRRLHALEEFRRMAGGDERLENNRFPHLSQRPPKGDALALRNHLRALARARSVRRGPDKTSG